MQSRETERNLVLTQVIAHRYLAAARVPPALHGEMVQIVRICLHQHRNLQTGEPERIGNGPLVAEVRKRNQNAVDLCAVGAEQIGAGAGVGPCFDRAALRGLLIQDDRFDVQRAQQSENIAPGFSHQTVREEIPVADQHSECGA